MARDGTRAPGAAGGKERVEEALAALEQHGVSIVRDATSHLAKNRAAAEYHPVPGEPGYVLVGEQTEYGDVMHEAKHFQQDRAAGFPGTYTPLARAQMEVEAHQYELEHAAEWHYSERESRRIVGIRDWYARQVRELEAQQGPAPDEMDAPQ
jgi:hypothetical protein